MIARIWHGWAAPENADAYEAFLRGEVLPRIHELEGYLGAYVLRRDAEGEVEFATVTLWQSLEAVSRFAGADAERAVVPLEARRLLSRFDARSAHYEVREAPRK
jgi:heme-degrading monooxygenase HmoA